MKIYTKTGDKGKTSLLGGTKVSKGELRIESYGTVDELNANLGLLKDVLEGESKDQIRLIQDNLFTIGAQLASDPDKSKAKIPELTDQHVINLENYIDNMDEKLPELRSFVLPGGHIHVSYCHISRAVCRRAERIITRLADQSFVDELVIRYMNRLSDYLFVLSRKMALDLGAKEDPWVPNQH